MRSTAIPFAPSKATLAASLAFCFLAAIPKANAQVPLTTYTDKNGYIDVQKLTCAQLASTYQEDADMLAAWYSGWYNGLAKKHFAHIARTKSGEHEVIVYCKANPQLKVIEAIDVVLKRK